MGCQQEAASTIGAVAVLIGFLWIPSAHAGNTTCVSRQMDWYSSVVGESPCTTYERLRQICNPDYQVPDFLPTVPGDRCNDQVSACCCNSIAFQLSMLCMNCQYVEVDGSAVGYDAAIGSYTTYRATCGPGETFHLLPADIQKAVCNKDIRLDDFLYGGWIDGSWFYVWTKENASKEHAVNNGNILETRCAKSSPSVTPAPTVTKPDDPNNSETNSPPTTTTASPSDPTGTFQTTYTTGLTTAATGTTHTTGHTIETAGTTGTANPTETTAAGVPKSLSGNDNADTATSEGSSSPTGLPAQNSTNTSEHSNVSVIIGGAVGGIGAIVLVLVAFALWKIRRSKNAKTHVTPDNPYAYAYRDDPYGSPTGFATPFGPGTGRARRERAPSPSPSPPPSAMGGSAALLATRTSVGRNRSVDSSPRSGGTSVLPSPQPTTTTPSLYGEDLSRHEDGGPVVQLVRSLSGRLPPAYRSWEQSEGPRRWPSDAFPRSVSDAVSQASEAPEHVWERQGDVYSESHHTPSASQSTTTAPPSAPAPPSEKASLYGNVPLAPMRRVDEL